MINYLDENYDAEAITAGALSGVNLFDNERVEYAVAIQMWPESNQTFRISSEVRYIDSTVQDEDEWGFFIELLFLTPNYTPGY